MLFKNIIAVQNKADVQTYESLTPSSTYPYSLPADECPAGKAGLFLKCKKASYRITELLMAKEGQDP